MKALRFDGNLKLAPDVPLPGREGEALVQVLCAGICNTDLEIVRGYAGFRGTPGHEFVGRVVESPVAGLAGRRVVGEINVGCGLCAQCRGGDSRHCPGRTVLGIKGRDGAFAEFLTLPAGNLIEVPDDMADETAVFVEPVAAACQVLDQVTVESSSAVAVIGDGKLAQLVARVLARTGCDLTIIGKHEKKLDLARVTAARCILIKDIACEPFAAGEKYDVVVEASGSPSGLRLALRIVRPRGAIVLKSTHHSPTELDLAQAVVAEVTMIGSRCGRFRPAVDLLASGAINVTPLISDRLPLRDGLLAFDRAAEPGSMKVLLQVAS
jgi:2-desacetyl-2-hydroxyethyl bacteriochlorophyllide A dehydrogenase